MKSARPVWEGIDTHGFGLSALLLALIVPGSAWLVIQASLPAPEAEDARRAEFVRSTAGIQGRVQLLREIEKNVVATAGSTEKAAYFRHRREEARQRISELTRSAASVAEGAQERARLAQLAVLVRAADARYDQVLVSASAARKLARLAMQK